MVQNDRARGHRGELPWEDRVAHIAALLWPAARARGGISRALRSENLLQLNLLEYILDVNYGAALQHGSNDLVFVKFPRSR